MTETNDTKAISDLKVKNDKNAGNNSPSSEKIIITVGNSDYEIPRLKEAEGKENLIDTVVEIVTKESHPATEKNSYSMIKKENITDGLKNKTVKNEETTGKVHITRDSENDTLNLIAETDKETVLPHTGVKHSIPHILLGLVSYIGGVFGFRRKK